MVSRQRSNPGSESVEPAVVGMYTTHPSPSHKDKLAFASRRMKARLFSCGIDEDDYVGRRVLDAGCGTGEYACWFAAHGADVLGIDLSDGSLAEARTYAAQHGIADVRFEKRSVLDTGLPGGEFDLVYCTGVLHHTAYAFEGLKELVRLVRPGGKILLSLYNKVGFAPRATRRRIARRLGGDDLESRVKWGRRLFPRVSRRLTAADRNDPESALYDYFAIPHESYHTIGQVLAWFDRLGVGYTGSFPPATLRDYPALLSHQSSKGIEVTFRSPLARLATRLAPTGGMQRKRPSVPSRAAVQLLWMAGGVGIWCMAGRIPASDQGIEHRAAPLRGAGTDLPRS